MAASEWVGIKALFAAAVELPAAERAAYLAGQAADTAILEEVRSLLSVYEASPDFLETPPENPVPAPGIESITVALAGRTLGPWVLVRELGRGGMGVVWEVRRADREYDQRAALKLLSCGRLSSADVSRFREERQIL